MTLCCMDYYNDRWDVDMQPGSVSTQLCNHAFISMGTVKWYCMVSDLICHFTQPWKNSRECYATSFFAVKLHLTEKRRTSNCPTTMWCRFNSKTYPKSLQGMGGKCCHLCFKRFVYNIYKTIFKSVKVSLWCQPGLAERWSCIESIVEEGRAKNWKQDLRVFMRALGLKRMQEEEMFGLHSTRRG